MTKIKFKEQPFKEGEINHKSGDELDNQNIPENQEVFKEGLREVIVQHITIPKLEIIEQTDNYYRVRFDDKDFVIGKDIESWFSSQPNASNSSFSLKLTLNVCVIESRIFQDKTVKPKFAEVMIVHEIREKEYKEAGLKDAHIRAQNDEVLYILEHFSPKLWQEYLVFAREYRIHNQKTEPEEEYDSYDLDKQIFSNPYRFLEFLSRIVNRYVKTGIWSKSKRDLKFAGYTSRNPTLKEWIRAALQRRGKNPGINSISELRDEIDRLIECNEEQIHEFQKDGANPVIKKSIAYLQQRLNELVVLKEEVEKMNE